MTDFSDLPPHDQQSIGKTLLTLLTGFGDRDPEALQRQADGSWLIVSEMFQDANT